jgi:GxxExxY protein
VDEKLRKTPFDGIPYQEIGCAMAVHRDLGPGLREDSYERALALKLSDSGLALEQQ